MKTSRCPLTRIVLALLLIGSMAGCQTGSGPLLRSKRSESNPSRQTTSTTVPKSAATPLDEESIARGETRSRLSEAKQVEAHLDLAHAYEAQGDEVTATFHYLQAIEASQSRKTAETRAKAHRKLAIAADRKGRFDEAEKHHQSAIKLASKNPKVWNDAGYSAYLQGNWEEAEKRLRNATKLSPNDSRILTNLGLTLAASGRTDDALQVLSQAGGTASAHANLGYILAAKGLETEARDQYAAALAIDPDLEPARLALTQINIPPANSPEQTLDPHLNPQEILARPSTPNSEIQRTSATLPSTSRSPILP